MPTVIPSQLPMSVLRAPGLAGLWSSAAENKSEVYLLDLVGGFLGIHILHESRQEIAVHSDVVTFLCCITIWFHGFDAAVYRTNDRLCPVRNEQEFESRGSGTVSSDQATNSFGRSTASL